MANEDVEGGLQRNTQKIGEQSIKWKRDEPYAERALKVSANEIELHIEFTSIEYTRWIVTR